MVVYKSGAKVQQKFGMCKFFIHKLTKIFSLGSKLFSVKNETARKELFARG